LFFLTLISSTLAAPPGMVDIRSVAPTVHVQIRYATPDNFLGEAFYKDATCYLTPQTADKVSRAEQLVSAFGYRLLLWDCTRDTAYQGRMWDSCVEHHGQDHCSGLVANPNRSLSHHTFGTTIDVGLVNRDGTAVELPSKYDSGLFLTDTPADKQAARPPKDSVKPALWSDASWDAYRVLQYAMIVSGFTGISSEWWHWES